MTVRIDQVDLAQADTRSLIDSWLARCPSATIYHTAEWNLIVQEVFATKCRYFLAHDRGVLVGMLPCHFVRSGRWVVICYSPPRMYEVSYGGPVAIGAKSAEVCQGLVKAAGHIGIGVIVDLFNSPQNTGWATATDWGGVTAWGRVTAFESAYVDLAPSLEEIWNSSLNGKRRNMIRKAEKQGVEIRCLDADGLDQYWALVERMAERAGIAPKPKRYYSRILEEFGPRDQARLYLAFRHDVAVAGGIFLRYRATCYYWVGASDNSVNLGQGELVQWQVIQWAKQMGCRWYDLVGVERERLPHIARFKLGFTGHIVAFHHLGYATALSRVVRRMECILKAR